MCIKLIAVRLVPILRSTAFGYGGNVNGTTLGDVMAL